MSTLDIIIVSYNTCDDLMACLRSLHEHPPTGPHGVLVVDNASRDHSAESVRKRWPAVRLIQSARNLGYARANNLGIQATRGDLILLLNPDTLVPPGALDRLAAAVLASPEVAAAGPRLVDAEGRPELSFGHMIGPFRELAQRLKGAVLRHQVPVLSRRVARGLTRPGYPDWVSGACLLVRRRDAEAVGLLDERYFLYGEDVDFCASLRRHGRRIQFVPEVEVVHHRGRAGARAPGHTRILYRQSQLAFYTKHHPKWVPWLRRYLWLRGELPAPPASAAGQS